MNSENPESKDKPISSVFSDAENGLSSFLSKFPSLLILFVSSLIAALLIFDGFFKLHFQHRENFEIIASLNFMMAFLFFPLTRRLFVKILKLKYPLLIVSFLLLTFYSLIYALPHDRLFRPSGKPLHEPEIIAEVIEKKYETTIEEDVEYILELFGKCMAIAHTISACQEYSEREGLTETKKYELLKTGSFVVFKTIALQPLDKLFEDPEHRIKAMKLGDRILEKSQYYKEEYIEKNKNDCDLAMHYIMQEEHYCYANKDKILEVLNLLVEKGYYE